MTRKQQYPQIQSPLILAVDIGGRPTAWVHWQQAVRYYALDRVGWGVGETSILVRGGINASGLRSEVALPPVIALRGADASRYANYSPPLSNAALFARDGFLCLYCGEKCSARQLTRDHVFPASRGGGNTWENCVAACKPCNTAKNNRTPEEARMPLLALPYTPNHAEALILANRHILADQMAFLEKRIPRRRTRS